ncbi:hypothetical protein GPECTOR_43g933 [Gonium pectorale]|uniref:Uncharacterized protein n=1 Tax=Gonium pectorale TaxID=33097 RepID=A0A150G9G9_GONPE|nr:hypothetical protein GPECTOR_43g933 [Gonium pectorale]|eukprot:KXZ46496.1 hypothetical protein GPECTOR_43g933 [Gonium pectorale]
MGLRGLPYMAAPSTTIINQMPSDAFNARFATDTLLQGLQSEVRALKSENMGLHDHIDQAWGQVAAAFKPPYTTASYPSDSDFTSTAYGAGASSSSSALTKELGQPGSSKDARRRLRELAFAVGSEVNDQALMDLTKSKAHRSYYTKVSQGLSRALASKKAD